MFEHCFLNTSHRLHKHHRLLPIGIGKKITISSLKSAKICVICGKINYITIK